MPQFDKDESRYMSTWKYSQEVGDLTFSLLSKFYNYCLIMSADPNQQLTCLRPAFTSLELVYSQARPPLTKREKLDMDIRFKETKMFMENYLERLAKGQQKPNYEIITRLSDLLDDVLDKLQATGQWLAITRYYSKEDRIREAYGVRKQKTMFSD